MEADIWKFSGKDVWIEGHVPQNWTESEGNFPKHFVKKGRYKTNKKSPALRQSDFESRLFKIRRALLYGTW